MTPQESLQHLKQVELLIYALVALGIPLAIRWKWHLDEAPASGPSHKKWRIADLVFWIGLPVLLYQGVPRITATRGIDPIDDGVLVAAFQQVSYGKLPYRDVFFHYGPLREIVQPDIAFGLFGRSLEGLRLFYWYVEPFGPILLYFLALVMVRRRWVLWLLPLVFVGRLDISVPERTILPTLALLCIVLAEKAARRQRLGFFLSGVFLAAAYLYSLESGILIGAAVGLYLLLQRRAGIPKILATAAGALLLFIPFLVWLALHGLLADFWHNGMLAGPFLGVVGKPVFPLSAWWLWFPVYVYMVGLAGPFSSAVRLVSLAGISHFVMAMGRADYGHWLTGSPLIWVVLPALIDRCTGSCALLWQNRPRRLGEGMRIAAAFLLGLVCFMYAAHHADPLLVIERIFKKPDLSPVRQAADITPYGTVVERLKELVPPGEYLYVFTDHALYYFLAERENPTRYPMSALLWDEPTNVEVVRDLTQKPPACILAWTEKGRLYYLPHQQTVATYIESHYRVHSREGQHVFLVPLQPKTNAKKAPTPKRSTETPYTMTDIRRADVHAAA